MADDPTPAPDPRPAADPDPTADPPREEPFDKERAMATISRQRESEAAAKKRAVELEAKVKQYEDAAKSDDEKREERAAGAEKRASDAAAEAARLRVALRKGLNETQAKRLVGDNEEALEKDADELLASFKSDEDAPTDPKRRPQERLRGGAVPAVDPESEPGLARLQRAYANAEK